MNDVLIQWGDGMQGPGTLTSLGNNRYEVFGGHTYATPGTYRVRVLAATGTQTTNTRPPLSYPPPFTGPYGATVVGSGNISPVVDSTVHVTGKALASAMPAVQFTGPSAVYIDTQDSSIPIDLGTLSGITPDPYADGPYAIVSFDDRATYDTYGTVTYGSGKYQLNLTPIYGAYPSFPPSGVHNLTVTVVLNDHVDPSQNTVLGVLHESLTISPDPPPGLGIPVLV